MSVAGFSIAAAICSVESPVISNAAPEIKKPRFWTQHEAPNLDTA